MFEGWFLLQLFKRGTGEGQMGGNMYVYFLFFLFRAFHSPSWEAKLPKSSFTFLFLSVSLQHKDKTKLSGFHFAVFDEDIHGFPLAPLDDLVQLLSGQEARVLPELPQSALELLLILVLQSLLLPLLSGAAALLPIIQPEDETFKMAAVAKLHVIALNKRSLLTLPQSLEWAASAGWVSSSRKPAEGERQARCRWSPGSPCGAPVAESNTWK